MGPNQKGLEVQVSKKSGADHSSRNKSQFAQGRDRWNSNKRRGPLIGSRLNSSSGQ